MIDIDKLSLRDKILLYADGDPEQGLPPHGFDFTREDTDAMLAALFTLEVANTAISNAKFLIDAVGADR